MRNVCECVNLGKYVYACDLTDRPALSMYVASFKPGAHRKSVCVCVCP